MTGMKALHVGLVNLHLHIAGNHFLNDLRHEVEAAEQYGQGDRTADRPACSLCCSSSPQAEPFCRSRTCAASSGLCPRWGWSRSAFRSSRSRDEFDLSVGAVFALAPMVMAVSMVAAFPFVPAVLLGLLTAAVFGFSQRLHHAGFGIPSFITTLGMLFVARSVTVLRRSPEFLFESLFAIKKARSGKINARNGSYFTNDYSCLLALFPFACEQFVGRLHPGHAPQSVAWADKSVGGRGS